MNCVLTCFDTFYDNDTAFRSFCYCILRICVVIVNTIFVCFIKSDQASIVSEGKLSILKRIDEDLLSDVRKKSEYIFEAFNGAEGVESVAGMGLMIGIKTVKPAGEVVAKCIENGVLPLTAKDKVRLLPALNIPTELLKAAGYEITGCDILPDDRLALAARMKITASTMM